MTKGRISSGETLAVLNSGNNKLMPRIAVIGHGKTSEGRVSTLMRIRPSTLERLSKVAIGPTYALLEVAILRMCEQLETAPEGEVSVIHMDTLAATEHDHELIRQAEERKAANPRNRTKVDSE